MDIHPVDVVISIINIIVLFVLLRLILWKYVIRYLDARRNRIQEDLDNAANARHEAESFKAEYNKRLKTFENQGEKIIRESMQKATDESDKIINDGKAMADKYMKDAETRIAMERKQAVIDAKSEIAQIATDMAASILMREVSPVDNERLVDDFFSKHNVKTTEDN